MTRFDASRVRDYYDRHTRAFIGLGEGRRVGAIRRAVRGPGVRDSEGAFHYVDDVIARIARELAPATGTLHLVDLGCGVAASLIYLAKQLPIRGTGITLSPVQARLGARNIADAGLASCVACLEGDYSDLPAALESADVAYAIESFVHAPDPARFFEQCARLVRRGGRLVICDDVRGASAGPTAEQTIDQFCRGWHVNALLRPEELNDLALAAGFEHERTHDLSPYLTIHRWRDRLIGAFLSLLRWLGMDRSRFDDLEGGRALQTCLKRGWVSYQIAVFRRLDTPAHDTGPELPGTACLQACADPGAGAILHRCLTPFDGLAQPWVPEAAGDVQRQFAPRAD